MRTSIRIVFIGLVLAAATATAASAAWTADFTPSAWNPAVGEIVQFSVCESCHGTSGSYTYLWDFNSDGVIDTETRSPVTSFSCAAEGFYAVKLTVRDAGGREATRSKGILAGALPAYGLREMVAESDGALLVSVTMVAESTVAALGLEEAIPAGWQAEVIDAAGGLTNYDAGTRALQVLWMSMALPGDQMVFTYRLYSNYASQLKQFSGQVTGYTGGARFAGESCGELFVP